MQEKHNEYVINFAGSAAIKTGKKERCVNLKYESSFIRIQDLSAIAKNVFTHSTICLIGVNKIKQEKLN